MSDNVQDAYPLTPLQKGMLFEALANPEKNTNIATVTFDLEGTVDDASLVRAWYAAISSYSALRTLFMWEGLEQPVQVVLDSVSLDIEFLDRSHCTEERMGDEVKKALVDVRTDAKNTNIEINKAPLMKVRVLRWSDTRTTHVWIVHHLVADAWSAAQVIKTFLNAASTSDMQTEQMSSVEYSFSDHVSSIDEATDVNAQNYWEKHLAGAQWSKCRFLEPRLGPTSFTAKPFVEYELESLIHEKLVQECNLNALSFSSYLHSIWAIVVAAYSDTSSPVFGALYSGRYNGDVGVDEAVGLYANTLPLHLTLDDDKPFLQWADNVQSTIQENQKFEFVDLQLVKAFVLENDDQTVFQSLVVIEPDFAYEALSSHNKQLSIDNLEYDVDNSVPITLIAYPSDTKTLKLVYDPDVFNVACANRMLEDLKKILSLTLSSPELSSLQLLDQVLSQHGVDHSANDSALGAVHEHTHVGEWFKDTAERMSSETALISTAESLDYAELQKQAQSIVDLLSGKFGVAGETIGICIEPVWAQIVAMFGVLSSNNAYLIIDSEATQERIQTLLENSLCSIVICDNSTRANFTNTNKKLIDFSHTVAEVNDARIMDYVQKQVPQGLVNDQAVYTMFTSGSTGTPKGVIVSHANLIYSTQARINYYEHRNPRFMLVSPTIFDSSVVGIYWSILGGGQLVVPNKDEVRDIQLIAELISKHRVDTILCLPAFYRLLLDGSSSGQLSSLRRVILAGEDCPLDLVEKHFNVNPGAELFNEYGPTECTVWSSVAKLTPSTQRVTIGRAISGTQITVRDSRGCPVPSGCFGEITISGPGVANGYVNNTQETQDKFRTQVGQESGCVYYRTGDVGSWSEDGELNFHGRLDRQIKIRGYRIEPVEIESVVNVVSGVQDCAIVGVSSSSTGIESNRASQFENQYSKMALYVSSNNSLNIQSDGEESLAQQLCNEIYMQLEHQLPSYMRPTNISLVHSIPKTASGKTDLKLLAVAEVLYTSKVMPHGNKQPVEEQVESSDQKRIFDSLCDIAKNVLDVSEIYSEDTFFELGGDSILAIMLVSQSRENGIDINVRQITDQMSFGEIASEIADQEMQKKVTVSAIKHYGEAPLTPIQQWFLSLNNPKPERWNIAYKTILTDDVGSSILGKTILDVLKIYPSLGAKFLKGSDGWSSVIPEAEPNDGLITTVRVPTDIDPDTHIRNLLIEKSLTWSFVNGWMLRFIVCENADGRTNEFHFIAHHLILDHLSAAALVRQISQTISQSKNTDIQPIRVDMSFREYCLELHDRDDPVDSADWSSFIDERDTKNQINQIESSSFRIAQMISNNVTRAIINSNKVWNVNMLEVLVASMETVWNRCNQNQDLDIFIESSVRKTTAQESDRSNIMGWLTTFFPVNKNNINRSSRLDLLKSVKNELRQNQDKNARFLQWFYRHSDIHPTFSSTASTLLINFMGSVAFNSSENSYVMTPYHIPELRDKDTIRPFDLELNTFIENDQLHLHWHFASSVDSELAERVCEELENELEALSKVATTDEDQSMYTPSDFSSISMSQEEIDSMLDDIG